MLFTGVGWRTSTKLLQRPSSQLVCAIGPCKPVTVLPEMHLVPQVGRELE
jgi:hypothetical protein